MSSKSILFTKARIGNFKCFKDTGDVELRPLTLLVGPNSSGKTAFLHAFLLLQQAAAADFSRFLLGEPVAPSMARRFAFEEGTTRIELEIVLQKRPRTGGTLKVSLRMQEEGFVESRQVSLSMDNVHYFYKQGALRRIPKDLLQEKNGGPAILQQFIYTEAWGWLLKNRIFWVGPLRSKPKEIYEDEPTREYWVGSSGQAFADVLRAHWKKVTLFVKRWLESLDVGADVSEVKKEEDGGGSVVWLVDKRYGRGGPGARRLPNEVGFGISQVLPVLVQGAVAPEGSLLLFEQPELHLHPKAQAEMGEVLADMASVLKAGMGKKSPEPKTVIVETHSELVLLRIARLVAEEKISPNDVLIYYFAPNSQKGTSLKKVEFDEEGKLKGDVPSGFFTEAFGESRKHAEALLGRLNKRKRGQER